MIVDRETNMMPEDLQHFISGQRTVGQSSRFGDIYNPAIGEVIRRAPFASTQEVNDAVQSAKQAFPGWAATPAATRGKIMSKFKFLLEEHEEELATLISEEHGKSMVEARGSLQRGIDVLDFAAGIASHLKGDYSENVARRVDSYAIRQPLGVCVGITPFNFPGMIPLWMGSVAIACGNSFLMKPSEKTPSCPLRIAELGREAGLPAGVFNVLHGDKEAVNALLTHDDVAAISFVGQTATAQYIYETASKQGKRVQAFGGAKNHMVIMPDADQANVVDALIGAAYGSAGERCMAISVAVCVGEELADRVIGDLKSRVKALKVGPFTDELAEMGPLITKEHYESVKNYIQIGVDEGAELVVDGRRQTEGAGYFLDGSLFDHVKPEMRIYKEEIFGPVLAVMRVPNYDAALELANNHPYGNGVAIFTRDGDTARDFVARVQVGMVGVNVPVPVPVAQHSFGGWKSSMFGDVGMHGMEGVRFFTKLKTVTQRWPSGIRAGVEFALPTTEQA
jgi:malonate-semialdehyde dehydrogenase (acetylating) / methylmalonate-semialdehyde dehydrogenase